MESCLFQVWDVLFCFFFFVFFLLFNILSWTRGLVFSLCSVLPYLFIFILTSTLFFLFFACSTRVLIVYNFDTTQKLFFFYFMLELSILGVQQSYGGHHCGVRQMSRASCITVFYLTPFWGYSSFTLRFLLM